MSLSTLSEGCGFRKLRLKLLKNQGGFFIVEVMILSFLVLACAGTAFFCRALERNLEAAEAEITAIYIAREEIAKIEAPTLGGASIRDPFGEVRIVRRNGRDFFVSSEAIPRADFNNLEEASVTVSWNIDGRFREKIYRKLVDSGE